MLTNTNKGPGLIQSLCANLLGVTLEIQNPVVSIAGREPKFLLSSSNEADLPPVTIWVLNGSVTACDDAAVGASMNGSVVTVIDGELMGSTSDDFVQELIDAYTLAHARKWKADQVALHGKAMQDSFVSLYSTGEMSSWPIKRAESLAFGASADPEDAPILAHEAAQRGITLAALCAKVDANSQAFAMLQATISGVEGMHRDAIAALTTFDQVNAYDYSTGWPPI